MKNLVKRKRFKILMSLIVCLTLVLGVLGYNKISVKAVDGYVDVSTEANILTYATYGGKIRLVNNIERTKNTFVKQDLVIDLNGNTLDMTSKVLVVSAGFTLTIQDSSANKLGKIISTGTYVIQVASGGTLIIEDGLIQSNGTNNYAVANIGTVKMNGGKIVHANNYAVINQGTFELNDGIIESVKTTVVDTGNFVMNGGLIHNTGDDWIGIQTGAEGASVIMNGGKILIDQLGTAVSLSVPNTSFIMNGGIIDASFYEVVGNKEDGGVGVLLFKDTEATINDGTINTGSFSVGTNGSVESASSTSIRAKVTINGGNLTSKRTCVYIPQIDGVNVITGGTITGGASAIEVRAGSLTISGGTFNGNPDEYVLDQNANGSSTIGSAVSVIQHNTKQPISVIITGGTFNGNVPFSEANTLHNSAEDVAKIAYDISGGVFNSTGDKTVDVENYDQGKFISGGKYTHLVTPYVKDGYGEKPENKMDAVYKWETVVLNQSLNGIATITRRKTISDDGETIVTQNDVTSDVSVPALYNDEIVISINPNQGWRALNSKAFDVNGNELNVDDEMFLMPNDNSVVTVVVNYLKYVYKEIDPSISVDEIDIGVIDKENTEKTMHNIINSNQALYDLAFNTDSPELDLVIEEKEIIDENKEKIKDKISKNEEFLKQYEVYLILKDKDGNELGRIDDFQDDIEFTVVLPDDIAISNRRQGAEYHISKLGENISFINGTVGNNGYTVSFKINGTSEFVLSYNLDEETIAPDESLPYTGENTIDVNGKGAKSGNPLTGDNLIAIIAIFIVSFMAISRVNKFRYSKLKNRYHRKK